MVVVAVVVVVLVNDSFHGVRSTSCRGSLIFVRSTVLGGSPLRHRMLEWQLLPQYAGTHFVDLGKMTG